MLLLPAATILPSVWITSAATEALTPLPNPVVTRPALREARIELAGAQITSQSERGRPLGATARGRARGHDVTVRLDGERKYVGQREAGKRRHYAGARAKVPLWSRWR